MHELEVAFDQVKRSGKRPKVYIYARWDECGNSILEQLKRLRLHPVESGRKRTD